MGCHLEGKRRWNKRTRLQEYRERRKVSKKDSNDTQRPWWRVNAGKKRERLTE